MNLVTDRTQADVQERNAKGTYNASDINRVNNAAVYLADEARDMLTDLEAYRESMGVANAPIFQPYTAEDVDVELPVIEDAASRLPDGYTELEYIESTGTQWIDTDALPNQNSAIELKIEFTHDPASAQEAIYGARTSDTKQFWAYYRYNSDAFAMRFGTTSTNYMLAMPAIGTHFINQTKNVFDVDGEQTSAPMMDFTSTYPIYLFGVNNQGSVQYPASVRIFYCKIYDNGTLIRDFVPCTDPSSAVGLYDIVGQQFYANAGTGAFTAGPEAELPITTHTTWQREDIPHPSQMTQYLANITNLRGLLPITGPEVPTDMEGLTYQEANDIEEILLLVDQARTAWLANAEEQIDYIGTYKNQLVSGTFYAGGNRTLQHFSRGR